MKSITIRMLGVIASISCFSSMLPAWGANSNPSPSVTDSVHRELNADIVLPLDGSPVMLDQYTVSTPAHGCGEAVSCEIFVNYTIAHEFTGVSLINPTEPSIITWVEAVTPGNSMQKFDPAAIQMTDALQTSSAADFVPDTFGNSEAVTLRLMAKVYSDASITVGRAIVKKGIADLGISSSWDIAQDNLASNPESSAFSNTIMNSPVDPGDDPYFGQ